MTTVLKYLGSVIAIVGGLLYVVANYSIADETNLPCKGSFYHEGKAGSVETIYFKVQKFRWRVHLWSESDGGVSIEKMVA